MAKINQRRSIIGTRITRETRFNIISLLTKLIKVSIKIAHFSFTIDPLINWGKGGRDWRARWVKWYLSATNTRSVHATTTTTTTTTTTNRSQSTRIRSASSSSCFSFLVRAKVTRTYVKKERVSGSRDRGGSIIYSTSPLPSRAASRSVTCTFRDVVKKKKRDVDVKKRGKKRRKECERRGKTTELTALPSTICTRFPPFFDYPSLIHD